MTAAGGQGAAARQLASLPEAAIYRSMTALVKSLPAELKLRSWREMNDKIDTAKGLGREFFSEAARRARLRVHQVVDELLESC